MIRDLSNELTHQAAVGRRGINQRLWIVAVGCGVLLSVCGEGSFLLTCQWLFFGISLGVFRMFDLGAGSEQKERISKPKAIPIQCKPPHRSKAIVNQFIGPSKETSHLQEPGDGMNGRMGRAK